MLSTAASNISPNFPMEIFCTSTKMPRVASTRISDSGRSDALPGFGVVVGSLGPENDQGPALSSVDEVRALIQYFIPIVEVADCRFTEGKPTGLVVPASGADGNSAILIGGHVSPQSVMMLAELPNPSVREVDIFKTGGAGRGRAGGQRNDLDMALRRQVSLVRDRISYRAPRTLERDICCRAKPQNTEELCAWFCRTSTQIAT